MLSPSGWARHRGPRACATVLAGLGALVGVAQAQTYAPAASDAQASGASVTYTPMVPPGAPTAPVAPVPPPTVPVPPAAPAVAAPPPAAPAWSLPYGPAPAAAPVYQPWPTAVAPPPAPAVPAPPVPAARASETVGVAAATAKPRPTGGRRFAGTGLDVGLPDGINAALTLAPTEWLRLGAALGTNTASFAYRGGLTLVPVGWGPSFSFEVGHCNMAATNSLVRGAFSAPAWVAPYVQELGYTYFNAHLGFDLALGNFIVFLHAGASYLTGTVRAPNSVVVDKNNGTVVTIAQDGAVRATLLSGKLGVVYMFGGT